jgi:xylan 1,4-beta-xylosidase
MGPSDKRPSIAVCCVDLIAGEPPATQPRKQGGVMKIGQDRASLGLAAALAVGIGLATSEGRAEAGNDDAFPVTMSVNLAQAADELRPIWRFFGADEPNYAYMKDGEKLLSELGELRPDGVYFRAHNLLTSGPGAPALKWGSTNAYSEDADGKPVHDWRLIDRIFDSYRARHVRPLVEIGFMPQALSIQPEPYRHFWRPGLSARSLMTGWRMPPKSYERWGELVYQWARHCVERYGADEVSKWYWETWNEANLSPEIYWGGTAEDFQKLHDFAVAGVRRALPSARVGGPHTAGDGGSFTRAFLTHCLRGRNYATGQVGTPLDFVAFHAKGSPSDVSGHVRMGIAEQLRTIDRGFEIVASFPELKDKPIIIGESDPEGCAACRGPALAYRNSTMYSAYTAAVFARKHDLAARHGVHLEGAVTWAFEFEDQPYFAGFRSLASNGIDKPVLNVFRMFSQMSGRRVPVESSAAVPLDRVLAEGVRDQPDVAGLASLAPGKLALMVWHYHDDDVPGPDAAVNLTVSGLPSGLGDARLTHYRIDDRHSNAYAAWKRLGSPIAPNEDQYAQLEQAGRLERLDQPASLRVEEGQATRHFALPRQAVSLLLLEWRQ